MPSTGVFLCFQFLLHLQKLSLIDNCGHPILNAYIRIGVNSHVGFIDQHSVKAILAPGISKLSSDIATVQRIGYIDKRNSLSNLPENFADNLSLSFANRKAAIFALAVPKGQRALDRIPRRIFWARFAL